MQVVGHLRGRRSVVLVAAIVLLAAAGAAYAEIPDSSGVYTACRAKANGAVRLIDPSAASTSPLSHCTQAETEVSWNAEGAAGKDGVSSTVAQLAPGDAHCPAGGAAITDAAGTTAYVCSAQTSGTFTSPNGLFSLTVSDTGVDIAGPGAKVSLDSAGALNVRATDGTVRIDDNLTEKVGGNETVSVSANLAEKANASLTVTAGANLDVDGSVVRINTGGACKPVARVGDAVDPVGDVIVTGSPTVCVG
jgi:Gp5 C-terminal repeat (3 copies)